METVEAETEERDPTEALRIAVMVLGLVCNVWIMWDYLRDTPEVMVLRRRVGAWWDRNIVAPERRAKAMRRAEGETVFEAIGIVEGHDAGD